MQVCCRVGVGPRRSIVRLWRVMRRRVFCIMQMEAGLDTGPILLREETAILDTDTTLVLHDRLAEIGAGAIVTALGQLDDLTACCTVG